MNDFAFGLRALFENPGFERRNFHGDLVGLEVDERVAGGNSIPFLLEPPGHGGFDDRFSEGRNLYGEHQTDPEHMENKVGIFRLQRATRSLSMSRLNITLS